MHSINFNPDAYPLVFTPPWEMANALLKRELALLSNELKNIKTGSLYIDHSNGRTFFIEYRKGERKRITKQPHRIYGLARREYIKGRINYLKTGDCSEIKKSLEKFHHAGLDISRIVMTRPQRKLISESYERKQNRSDDLIYKSPGGIYFRSKSEMLIGTLLEELHIPYRTEPRLFLNGIVFHPDFMIMLPDNRLAILEHCGRTDLDEYLINMLERLRTYEANGLTLGVSVFVTFEQHTVSQENVMEIIDKIIRSSIPDVCSRLLR